MRIMQVLLNDKPVGKIEGGSLAAAKRWVQKNITSTHMGEWRRLPGGGYEYATTIGQYYTFVLIHAATEAEVSR